MADVTKGFDRSGGWRFGNNFSDLFTNLYSPEKYNAALLEKVGNPFEKKAATPTPTPTASGLLSNSGTAQREGGASGDRSTSGLAGNGTNFTDAQWGTIKEMNDKYGLLGNPVNQVSFDGLKSLVSGNYEKALGTQSRAFAEIAAYEMEKAAREAAALDAISNPSIAPGTPQAQALADAYAQYNNPNAGISSGSSGGSSGGYVGGYDGYGSNGVGGIDGGASVGGSGIGGGYSSANDSNNASNSDHEGNGGGGGGDRATGGRDGDASGGGDRGTRGGFSKGGLVKKKNLSGKNPKGPDEGKANLQSGEFVVKKSAVKKLGVDYLADYINKGMKGKK